MSIKLEKTKDKTVQNERYIWKLNVNGHIVPGFTIDGDGISENSLVYSTNVPWEGNIRAESWDTAKEHLLEMYKAGHGQ